MGIADFAQNKANETKLKAQLALNSEQMKQNWLWKLQAGLAEKKLQNQATMDLVNQMRSQDGEGISENGSLGISGPETRIGSGGKLDVHYPSTAEKNFKIKQTWAQIDKKQAKGLPLNNLEKTFMEKYPKEVWLKNKGIASSEGLFDSETPSAVSSDVDSLKPDEVDQADWDVASLEEKTEFLKAIGKINA
jgi:hypothetical protein